VAATGPSTIFLTVVVVIIIAAAGAGAGVLYLVNHPKRPSTPEKVAIGDNATVNYIGLFASGPETGKVFDTSIKSVAENNVSWPKSLEYSPRNASGYTPLPVHVGPHSPKSGYQVNGVTYSSVVTGFWEGLVGLAVNQTRSTTFAASLGYGALNTSCLKTAPLVQTVPVDVTYTPSGFAKANPGTTAAKGVEFSDPIYGWTDVVASANATAVVVAHDPSVGETVTPFGWTVLVRNISSRVITLQSELTPSSAGNVLGTIANTTVCSSTKFIVWSVDLSAGTFTENYNREVVGESLTFIVTIASILPP
jgi:hypothetical protein